MKNRLTTATAFVLCLATATALSAQSPTPMAALGASNPQPRLDKEIIKLFGDNSAFTASMEATQKGADDQPITVPCKLTFDRGNTRVEMDLSQVKGGPKPPDFSQMKSLGIDLEKVVVITRTDRKNSFLIYPGMKSYAEMPRQDAETATSDGDIKVEFTELGKETVDGRACVKCKAVITDAKGSKTESTVWRAADLKNFPVKIQENAQTILFKDIVLSKPQPSLFEPPTDFTKYDNASAMIQGVMMKSMGGGQGFPGMPR
jgi:hypothetical protein